MSIDLLTFADNLPDARSKTGVDGVDLAAAAERLPSMFTYAADALRRRAQEDEDADTASRRDVFEMARAAFARGASDERSE